MIPAVSTLPKLDRSEYDRCLLCEDAPCEKACPQGIKLGKVLRSMYFLNPGNACELLENADCASCNAPCEAACVMGRNSSPIAIKETITCFKEYVDNCKEPDFLPAKAFERIFDKNIPVDLGMDICGVQLENPFLLSSSVVASSYDMCARAFEAGWAGASFKTICSFPQHEASPRFSSLEGHSKSFYGFKNIEQLSDHSVKDNLHIFEDLKRDYPSKVIVASIMGKDEKEWESLARDCQNAGADVIECNFSCPNMESAELGITIGQDPALIERFSAAAKRGCTIPVLAKLTPNVADMVPMALAAKKAGADGIAAINTINSISGVDIYSFKAEPNVHGRSIIGGYSGPAVKPIALRFIADLGRDRRLSTMHISGMGGIESWVDAVEFLSLGAGSLQVTTAVMQYGYRIIDDLVDGLSRYLRMMNIRAARNLCGAAVGSIVDHTELERDTILLPKFNTSKCLGCGRCYISCRDGGHQAIEFNPETRTPKLVARNCVGCHLCRIVCPSGAIGVVDKRFTRPAE